MHELALTESLVEALREEAARQGFVRVRRVTLEVGALSHVEPEALAFCFEVATRGTLAEGATLAIERPPGSAFCTDCGGLVSIAARGEPCPGCGGYRLLVRGGEELRLRELEVV
jgi:hydrogenase nickel incorporation protein HypA/HybF